jgi:hypothetical protein
MGGMPIHHIELNIPAAEIMNTDAVFKIWSDDELLGELCLSRGSIDWRPGRKRSRFRLEWEQFDALMQEHGRWEPAT